MFNPFKLCLRSFLIGTLSFVLSGCQFGFMSVENEKAPIKEAFNFSTNPLLVPSRLAVSFDSLRLNQKFPAQKQVRLGRCEPMQISVANLKSSEVALLSDVSVDLSSGNSADEFYLSSSCTGTQIIKVTLKKGESYKIVYYKPKAVGNRSIFAVNNLFSSVGASVSVLRVATSLRINNSPSLTHAGECSTGFTMTALDFLGQPIPKDFPLSSTDPSYLAITSSLGNPTFYSDSSCSTILANIQLPMGQHTTGFVYLKVPSNFSGIRLNSTLTASFLWNDLDLEKTYGKVDSAGVATTFTRETTQIEFENVPQSVNVGTCSGGFKVVLKDKQGREFNEASNRVITLNTTFPGDFYSGPNCSGSAIGSSSANGFSYLIGSGSSAVLSFKPTSTAVGRSTFSAETTLLSGLKRATATMTVDRKATQIVIESGPPSVNVGVCSGAITLKVKDALNLDFNESPRSISLASDVIPGGFFTDSICSNSAPVLSLLAGQTSKVFYFKPSTTATGDTTISAASTLVPLDLTSSARGIRVVRLATQLVFEINPANLKVFDCAGPFTIVSKDNLNNPFTEIDKPITNLSSTVQGSFFTDNSCTNLQPIKISTSQPRTSFFFKINSLDVSGEARFTVGTGDLSVTSGLIPIHRIVFDQTFNSNGKWTDGANGEVLALAKYMDGYVIGGQSGGRAYLKKLSSTGTPTVLYSDSNSSFSQSSIHSILVEGNDIYFAGHAVSAADGNRNWLYGKVLLNSTPVVWNADTGTSSDSAIGIESVSPSKVAIIGNRFEVQICNKSDGMCDCLVTDTSTGSPTCTSNYVSPASGINIAKKTAKDSSDQIWVVGSSDSKMSVMRFNPLSLSSSLPIPTQLFSGAVGTANAIAFDSFGNALIVGGISNLFLAITRLNSNLTVDLTFGSNGLVQDAVASEGFDIAIEPSGGVDNILIASASSNQMLIRRYQPNGTFGNPNNSNSNLISFYPLISEAKRLIRDGYKIVLGGKAGGLSAVTRIHP